MIPKKNSNRSNLVKLYGEYIKGENYKLAPKEAGIYALYQNKKLQYIGLSETNVHKRVRGHWKNRNKEGHFKHLQWNEFSFYQIPFKKRVKYIKDIETLFLRIVNPPLNKRSGKFDKKYRNLAKELSKVS